MCLSGPVDKWLRSLESHFVYQLEWLLVAAVPSLPPCLLLCKLGSNPMTCQLPYFFLGWMGAQGPWGPWGTDSGDQVKPFCAKGGRGGGRGGLGSGSGTGWGSSASVDSSFFPNPRPSLQRLLLPLFFTPQLSPSSSSSLRLRIPICGMGGTIHLSHPPQPPRPTSSCSSP